MFVELVEDLNGDPVRTEYNELTDMYGYYECCSCDAEFHYTDPYA